MNVCLADVQDIGIVLRKDFCQRSCHSQAVRAVDV